MRKILLLLLAVFSLYTPYIAFSQIDLSIEWVKVNKEVARDGEIVQIRAMVKNIGGESGAFAVSFYYDVIDEEHLIDRKHYISISSYRIPSVEWDTKGLVGEHRIIVHVSDSNDENNYGYCNITILPGRMNAQLLIKEIYYHARPHRNNEFICIVNAGEEKINLTNFYLTTQPWKRVDKQNKVFLPAVELEAGEGIYLTQNGSSFEYEMGFQPDYEYYNCSSVPDAARDGKFIMANDGGVVCLKDKYNHTIDTVVYGDASFGEGWKGEAIEGVEAGEMLKRRDFIDTNTSNDWRWNRTFIIGQSNFEAWHGMASKAIAFCSPDCSYEVISEEIKNAHEIFINLYTFTNPYLADILNESNASIKILLDGNVIGGIPMEERWIAYMLSKKAEVRYMFGNEEEGIYKRYRYNHAKYAVLDERCIIESANWGKSGVPVDPTYGNREWGIVLVNESIANFMEMVFESDWNPDFQDSVTFDENSFTHGKPPDDYAISYYIPSDDYTPSFSPLYINSSFNITIILSPDNAEEEIKKLIDSANEEILVEQLYVEKEWSNGMNPFLKKIVEKNESGVAVYVLLNGNPSYYSTVATNKETEKFLESHGIKVKLQKELNIHNKGMVIDGKTVLISSINWGENSVRRNREAGVIVENEEIASYFEKIFWYDWDYEAGKEKEMPNEFFAIPLFLATFLIIYLYRKR